MLPINAEDRTYLFFLEATRTIAAPAIRAGAIPRAIPVLGLASDLLVLSEAAVLAAAEEAGALTASLVAVEDAASLVAAEDAASLVAAEDAGALADAPDSADAATVNAENAQTDAITAANIFLDLMLDFLLS